MHGGQYQPSGSNNTTAIKLLWAGIICYALGFITPQYIGDPAYFQDNTLYTWNLLTPLGMGFIALGIFLSYIAITKARLFEGVKKFGITGAFLIFIAILVIQSIKTDFRNQVGTDIVEASIGYYALWLGLILSVIGSFKAISYPQYVLQGYGQPQQQYYPPKQGYQQPQQQYYQPQQGYQQPPVQPPSYIDSGPIYTPPQKAPPTRSVSETNIEHNYCGSCAMNNEIGVKFCINCGTQY